MGGDQASEEASGKNKYDGREQGIGTFMRKLGIATLGKKVQEKLCKGENLETNADSDNEDLKKLFNK